MKFSKKTLGVVAFSAALIIPAIGFVALSQLDKANASDEHLSDEEVFASHYRGLTKSEITTYVNYLDKIEQYTSKINQLTKDGEVLNREQYDQLQAERDCNGAIIQHWKPSDIEKVIIPVLDMDEQKEIAEKVQESFRLRKKSKELLDIAVKAVEMAIETDEESALAWLGTQNE